MDVSSRFLAAMSNPSSIRSVIDLWPTRRDMAADMQVSTDRVHKWAKANAIPARFHLRVIEAATARGFPVTADLLVQLHHAETSSEAEAA
jgi:hypothetical protein